MKASRRPFPTLLFDFDSTLVRVEALDELFALAGGDEAGFRAITDAGMDGTLPHAESLARRLALFPDGGPDPKLLPAAAALVADALTPSVLRHASFFREHRERIRILSGGFRELIERAAGRLGLGPDRVTAHAFRAHPATGRLGLDAGTPMARGGKVGAVNELVNAGAIPTDRPRWIIGDGATDLELRTTGTADRFIAFTENVVRPPIVAAADHRAASMDDLLELLHDFASTHPADPNPSASIRS